MLRERFAGATVVTIAHRVGTVADYDLAVVMHAGRVAETGRPAELLADPGSAFYALAHAAPGDDADA
jgi:ATP-binding cassette subfamily C (CFTR/MRP) protein 1